MEDNYKLTPEQYAAEWRRRNAPPEKKGLTPLDVFAILLVLLLIFVIAAGATGWLQVWLPRPAAQPQGEVFPQPTADIMPTRRPIVQQQAPVLSMPIPTLIPGLATEQESEAIYLATAEAMQAGPPIPDGVEYGSKPSQKAWPTPAPAVVEVQAAPVPTPDRFGSKPSQKRHP